MVTGNPSQTNNNMSLGLTQILTTQYFQCSEMLKHCHIKCDRENVLTFMAVVRNFMTSTSPQIPADDLKDMKKKLNDIELLIHTTRDLRHGELTPKQNQDSPVAIDPTWKVENKKDNIAKIEDYLNAKNVITDVFELILKCLDNINFTFIQDTSDRYLKKQEDYDESKEQGDII